MADCHEHLTTTNGRLKAAMAHVNAEPGTATLSIGDVSPLTGTSRNDAAAYWLWVDPKRESNYDPKTFDQGAFLRRAMALFQSKERWGGQKPQTVKVHPAQSKNGLSAVARALGLQVMEDPRVTPGTYRLGLATEVKEVAG